MSNLKRYTTGLHNDGSYMEVESCNGEWVKFDDIKEFLKPTVNSDYAAALRAVELFQSEGMLPNFVNFIKWLRYRLNSAKAPNCA